MFTNIKTKEQLDAEQHRLEQQRIKLVKQGERQKRIDAIVVRTRSNRPFDGDEAGQTRMQRKIAALLDGQTTEWKLANNRVESVSKEELMEAFRLADAELSRIWIEMES